MNFTLEIIGFSIDGCIIAQEAGADRIELCDNPDEGGTTASYGFIKAARKKLDIDLYPMIHPRGGDFYYADDDFEIIKTDVKLCKELGCNGVVIGALTKDGKVDKKKCSLLVGYAYPLGVTFHRAFDRTYDPFVALEDIIDTGCERILTSGQKPTAMEGKELLKQLIQQADGRIIIMPGSGIKAENVSDIAESTGATEFHTSARIRTPSKMNYKNYAMNEKQEAISVDGDEVRKIISELKSLQIS